MSSTLASGVEADWEVVLEASSRCSAQIAGLGLRDSDTVLK
jgi:hypothetical protein